MDFFARQAAARRKTGWLIVMFFLALAGIVASAYIACTVILQVAFADHNSAYQSTSSQLQWNPEILLGVSSIISLIVFGGTAAKMMQLKQGGEVVAESMGGRQINPASTQFYERRLLNVVEEMALAAGVPVPPVYVMTGQRGINAFAAGYSINDAVIGVTEGTMKGLKREELQGVIGHEFSHILNGDMRMNIRLIGILHGLLIMAIVGRVLLRVAGSSNRGSGKKGGGVAVILALGLALIIIGYAGYFFGGLIKRAVSRQREYLADASAVQFTRDAAGLASALKKIGGLVRGGTIDHPRAEELSHMFFADGIKRFFGSSSLFSTHPPLKRRVKLLDPSFDGEFPIVTEDSLYLSGRDGEKPAKDETQKASRDNFVRRGIMMGGMMAGASPQSVLQQIGLIDAGRANAAGDMVASLPDELVQGVRETIGAQSVILALLVQASTDRDSADAWTWIPASFVDPVSRYIEHIRNSTCEQRLLLVEMSLPALRGMSREQARRFLQLMQQVIDADQRCELMEFAIMEMIRTGLRVVLGTGIPAVRFQEINAVSSEVSLLLSMMAVTGSSSDGDASKSFEKGAESLRTVCEHVEFQSAASFKIDIVLDAIARLQETAMIVRRQFLEACLTCLMADRTVTPDEFTLFRALAAALEVPVPPVIRLDEDEAVMANDHASQAT